MALWTTPVVVAHQMRQAGSVMTVGGSAASGLDAYGALGGLLGGLAAVVGIVLTIASMNRKNRRAYEQDMQEAESRGESRYRDDMVFWRGIAMAHLFTSGQPFPVPPSQQHPSQPLPPLPNTPIPANPQPDGATE